MTPAEFISELWGIPYGGYVQLWRLTDRRSFYLQAPQAVDAYAEGQRDVYTGVALAGEPHGRFNRARADQAVAIPGLWLDIDVDENHGPTLDDAMDLAWAVCEPTIVVHSGYGLHAWHLFDAPWRFRNRDEQSAAATLAAQWTAFHRGAALEQGFSIDHTHDLARLLRLPGTVNGKGGRDAPVRVYTADGVRHLPASLREATAGVDPALLPGAQSAETGELPKVDIGPGRALDRPVLDALLENSTEFRRRWMHVTDKTTASWSLSEYDLALASIAAGAGLTDQQLADLIATHRRAHNPGDQKAERRDYLQRTVARARRQSERTQDVDFFRSLTAPKAAA